MYDVVAGEVLAGLHAFHPYSQVRVRDVVPASIALPVVRDLHLHSYIRTPHHFVPVWGNPGNVQMTFNYHGEVRCVLLLVRIIGYIRIPRPVARRVGTVGIQIIARVSRLVCLVHDGVQIGGILLNSEVNAYIVSSGFVVRIVHENP